MSVTESVADDNVPLCFMSLEVAFMTRTTRDLKNSLKSQKKLDSGLGVEVMQVKGDKQMFMENYLSELYVSKRGVFSKQRSFGNRRPNLYVYDCEKSCFNKASSTGDAGRSRANGCKAYVSFSFEEGATSTICILRYRLEHLGHTPFSQDESKIIKIDPTLKAQILEWTEIDSDLEIVLQRIAHENKLKKLTNYKDRRFFPGRQEVQQLISSVLKPLKDGSQDTAAISDELSELLKTTFSSICLYYHPPVYSGNSYKPMILIVQSPHQKDIVKKNSNSLFFICKNFNGLRFYGSAVYALVVKDDLNQLHCVSYIVTSIDDPNILIRALRKFQNVNKIKPSAFFIDRELVVCYEELVSLYSSTKFYIPHYQVLASIQQWLAGSAVNGAAHREVREVLLKYVFDLSRCNTEDDLGLGINELEKKVDYPEFKQMLKSKYLPHASLWCEFGRLDQFYNNSIEKERDFLRSEHKFLKGVQSYAKVVDLVSYLYEKMEDASNPKEKDEKEISPEDQAHALLEENWADHIIWLEPHEILIPIELNSSNYYWTNLITMECDCPKPIHQGFCVHIILGQMLLSTKRTDEGVSDYEQALIKFADSVLENSDFLLDEITCSIFHNNGICVTKLSDHSCTCIANSFGCDCVGAVFLRKYGPPSESMKIECQSQDDVSDAETVTAVNSPSGSTELDEIGELWQKGSAVVDSEALHTKLADIKDENKSQNYSAEPDPLSLDLQESENVQSTEPTPLESIEDTKNGNEKHESTIEISNPHIPSAESTAKRPLENEVTPRKSQRVRIPVKKDF